MARVPFTSVERRAVKDRDENRCRKCQRRDGLNIHHITPVVDGGTNDLDNLILLCMNCHAEWHIVGAVMPLVGWERWLALPPMAVILHWLVVLEQQDMTALTTADAWKALQYAFDAFKTIQAQKVGKEEE